MSYDVFQSMDLICHRLQSAVYRAHRLNPHDVTKVDAIKNSEVALQSFWDHHLNRMIERENLR